MGRYMNSDVLYLKIEDKASGIEFVDLEFDAEQLANLMNQSIAYMEGKVRGLSVVGKRYVSKTIQVRIPDKIGAYNKEEIANYLLEYERAFEKSNEGWKLDKYIGSQSSISHEEDGNFANLKMFQYVDDDINILDNPLGD